MELYSETLFIININKKTEACGQDSFKISLIWMDQEVGGTTDWQIQTELLIKQVNNSL